MAEIITAQVVEGLNRKYFRAQDLRRLAHVVFSSRRRIEGRYSGRHETLQRGQSVEFQDYRQYIPGDDLTEVDWKAYGRTDKLFVKLFEHQSDMTVRLLVDASASMDFRGCLLDGRAVDPRRAAAMREAPLDETRLSKFDQACLLAAAIAFLVAKQNDRAALAFAQSGLQPAPPPADSLSRLVGLLLALERQTPAGRAGLADAVQRLMAASGKRDLLVVLGDLWEDREPTLSALSAWRERGGEVIIFHVLHADELELPAIGPGLFIDSETGERLRIDSADLREAYNRQAAGWRRGWAQSCQGRGLDYNLAPTNIPHHVALESYFRRRSVRGA